jgi:eukaryotic-like serine/threonine-protein kinase
LNLRNRKSRMAKASVLIAILLITIFLLSGCVSKGMSPIGWAGVAENNGTLFTASKEGRVVSVTLDLSNASRSWADPLKVVSTGGGCGIGGGSSSGGGLGCSSGPTAVAIYGTPALANNIPVGIDDKGNAVMGSIVVIAGYNGKIEAYQANNLKNKVWEYPTGGANIAPVVSGLTVSGNKIYFGTNAGLVYALDTLGKEKWSAPFQAGGQIWSTSIVDNDLVIFGAFDKKVYALDANTGAKKWEFVTGATVVSTAIAQDGIVYIGSLDSKLYALDEKNGSQLWSFKADNWLWAKPVYLNGVVYAATMGDRVYGLDAKSGANIHEFNVEGQVASWPAVAGKEVIVATTNGKLWALNTAEAGNKQRLVTSNFPAEVNSPLMVANNIIYVNGLDNNIYTFDMASGNPNKIDMKYPVNK